MVEVLIHRRVLVAQLLCLVEKILAKQVTFDLYIVTRLVLIRVIVIAHLVFLLHLLDDTVTILLLLLALL